MDILRLLHSWNRWLLLVVIVVAVIYFLIGWLQKRPWDSRASTLVRVFPILVDIQWALGLLFFLQLAFSSGSFDLGVLGRHNWEHAFTMTIALLLAHVPMMWRKRAMSDEKRYRNHFLVVVGLVAVIVLGIFVLPSVIQWRFYTGA
ncbi:MAG: hypothetical protein HXY40_13995 [Chloroflexi bacterium]|nr:hypothetical protein [Chloroflexota bacterium]